MSYKRLFSHLAFSGACLLIGSTIQAQTLSFATSNYPGANNSIAFGINNKGDIVGAYGEDHPWEHGYRLKNGRFSGVDFPGASLTTALGINETGTIVGSYTDASGAYHGFQLQNGVYESIDYPGATGTAASGIDDAGNIVGWYSPCDIYGVCGFLLTGTGFISLQFQGSMFPRGINDSGHVVGYFDLAGGIFHGFTEFGNNYSQVDYPGAVNTRLTGINNTGVIVGSYTPEAPLYWTGFVFDGGSFTPFSFPGAGDSGPFGINDRRQMVGYYSPRSDVYQGFVATELCGDDRDNMIGEYQFYDVDLFPVCEQFTNDPQKARSKNFTFNEINTGDYAWAMVRKPLIAPESMHYGLDAFVAAFGGPRHINSAYRNPARNAGTKEHTRNSRHMYGDAVDFRNESKTDAEWDAMVAAAFVADADAIGDKIVHGHFYKDPSCARGRPCVHVDWRYHPGTYVH